VLWAYGSIRQEAQVTRRWYILALYPSILFPGTAIEVPDLRDYYSVEAKELVASALKYQKIFAEESSILEKLGHPYRDQTRTPPSLVLPPPDKNAPWPIQRVMKPGCPEGAAHKRGEDN
jgi:hypothetical protein